MKLSLLILLVAVTLMGGCAVFSPARPEPTLYEQLGGREALDAVAELFVLRIATNPHISHHFETTDLRRLRAALVEQLCMETGGPCVYTGRPMREAHASLGIRDHEFDALVADLVAVLDEAGVDAELRKKLVGRLAGMRSDIVTM